MSQRDPSLEPFEALRWWRDVPGLHQRFSATLGHDVFDGTHQLAETQGEWQDDMKVTYRRRD